MIITPEIFDLLKEKSQFRGKIITDSMSPVIKVGEEIVVEVLSGDLRRFDIIVFKQDDKLICHYLWGLNQEVEPRLMQTKSLKGDKDLPIKPEDYLGKVVSHKLSLWRKLRILFKQ